MRRGLSSSWMSLIYAPTTTLAGPLGAGEAATASVTASGGAPGVRGSLLAPGTNAASGKARGAMTAKRATKDCIKGVSGLIRREE